MGLGRLRPALAALLLATPAALAAAEPGTAQAFAEALRTETGAPGAGVGWIVDGKVAVAVAGVRARGTDAAVGPQDLWHIGSNATAMTATLVARLVEAGVVGWDDTVGERLADLDPRGDYRDVTLEMLLSHRAGLPANLGFFATRALSGPRNRRDVMADRRSYARSVLGHEPDLPPGSGFLYSNAGYVVAGAMLEAATGQSWEDLMEAWVFEPLDMETVGYGAPGNAQTLSQPRGHGGPFAWSRGAVAPGPDADNIPAMGPAGTLHMSLRDHLRFLRAHLARPGSFLTQDSWDRLHADVAGQGYALGWSLRSDGALVHAGSNTYWFDIALVDPVRGIVVALVVNDGAIRRVRPAAEAVLAQILAGIDAAQ